MIDLDVVIQLCQRAVRPGGGVVVDAVRDPDDLEVLADIERTLRDAAPLPHTASGSTDVETLLQLIEAGESEYQRLIQAHVDHAEKILRDDRHTRTALGGVA